MSAASTAALHGKLFDGRTAARHAVDVEVSDARMTVISDGVHALLDRNDVRADPPIPGVPRRLLLPGGAEIETDDRAAVDALWPVAGRIERAAYWLESRT